MLGVRHSLTAGIQTKIDEVFFEILFFTGNQEIPLDVSVGNSDAFQTENIVHDSLLVVGSRGNPLAFDCRLNGA